MSIKALTKEEQILAARAKELAESALARDYELYVSRFLSPAEQNLYYTSIIKSVPSLRERIFFWGGAVGADRRVCVILPSFIETWDSPAVEAGRPSFFSREREVAMSAAAAVYLPDETYGITPLKISGSGYATLTHRDYMGSILGLGVEREMIGDIVPLDDRNAVVFASSVTAPFIASELLKIGRDTVKITPAHLSDGYVISKKYEEKLIIAASARVDAVVAGFTGVSRADAKSMCLGGLVDVNYITEESPDRNLAEGDTVSVRGYGKFIIDSFDGLTGSGRSRISVKKYI